MMQITDAFTRVNNTVSQFIQNWQIITEVRSINRRLGEFEQQLGAPKQEKDAAEKASKKPLTILCNQRTMSPKSRRVPMA